MYFSVVGNSIDDPRFCCSRILDDGLVYSFRYSMGFYSWYSLVDDLDLS